MPSDPEAIKKICDIYDWDGKGVLDMYFFGDIIYALGMNITKKICVGLGQQEEENKKYLPFDDVVKLVHEAEKAPDREGTYHDYVELCKLYDKNENGTMMLAELENILSNLGDTIPKEDTQALLAEMADPEDEDGFFPYTPFLNRLVGKA
jgi:Ca2+-binding EF-hand superfamily protein